MTSIIPFATCMNNHAKELRKIVIIADRKHDRAFEALKIATRWPTQANIRASHDARKEALDAYINYSNKNMHRIIDTVNMYPSLLPSTFNIHNAIDAHKADIIAFDHLQSLERDPNTNQQDIAIAKKAYKETNKNALDSVNGISSIIGDLIVIQAEIADVIATIE